MRAPCIAANAAAHNTWRRPSSQATALADLQTADLTKARQALLELQTVATRLREELDGVVPTLRTTPSVRQTESHPEVVVHTVVERIQKEYARPLTLKQCAHDLHLSPAYLCTLFAHLAGLPFKTFLTEVRMEKARELLSDHARNISDVACAVGYASENRFRIAFKKVTGLSPRRWRETLKLVRAEPPALAPEI